MNSCRDSDTSSQDGTRCGNFCSEGDIEGGNCREKSDGLEYGEDNANEQGIYLSGSYEGAEGVWCNLPRNNKYWGMLDDMPVPVAACTSTMRQTAVMVYSTLGNGGDDGPLPLRKRAGDNNSIDFYDECCERINR